MPSLFHRLAALVVALLVSACAMPPEVSPMIRQGVIEQITPTTIQNSGNQGVGAIVGGVTGAGLGSLVGRGTGRDVAMVAGAVGGTMAGSQIASNMAQPIAGQEIFVRTDSGVLVEVTQPVTPGLRVGQRVFIQGAGESARVVPQ